MQTGRRLDIGRLGQIGITVGDLEKATAFYRDTLELKLLFEAPGMSFFDLGEIRLMLGTATDPGQRHPASILYYRTDDIQRTAATLKRRGVAFEREPFVAHREGGRELWLAFFRDVEQNVLALMSEADEA